MIDKPAPKEIDDLVYELRQAGKDDTYSLVCAVLAKWGQPVVAGDVDRADAVNLARNALTQYDCAITKKGVRVLAEAVLSMDSALTTPQPTQAQAGAVPLDEARRLFDAGWKAAALFCDREDVVADGIIGFGACPQFEAAFSAAQPVAREPLPKFLALKFHARRDKKATVTLLFPGHEAADAWVRGIKVGQHGTE